MKKKNACMLFVLSMLPVVSCVQGMEEEIAERQITLLLLPSSTYSLKGFKDRPDVYGNINASIHGFNEHNKIELATRFDAQCCTSTTKDIYCSERVLGELAAKKMEGYPLSFHKKIQMLVGNERLVVRAEDNDGRRECMAIPERVTQRLLHYFLNDVTECNRSGFDLLKEVILDHAQPDEQVNQQESLINYVDFIAAHDIVPGDMVGLCTIKEVDGDYVLKFKQYAIALGKNMYLAKLGLGGCLYVSDMESLKQFWKCTDWVKINGAIGKRDDFITNPFRRILCRMVRMMIRPHSIVPIVYGSASFEFFATWLYGFGYAANQVQLRSDMSNLSGTFNNISFKTTDELYTLLVKGEMLGYPLHVHKQLSYMVGNEVLLLFIDHKDGSTEQLSLPHAIKKRLLAYLMFDSQDRTRDCYNFCKEVCFFCDHNPQCDYHYEYVDESDLKPGDIVRLGTLDVIKGHGYIDYGIVHPQHDAMVLSNGLYLSKFGRGGMLFVTDMKKMMDVYGCKKFFRVTPDCTN